MPKLEVPDLTHPETVALFRQWDLVELAFVQLLRFIRIFRDEPDQVVVSRPGNHHSIVGDAAGKAAPPKRRGLEVQATVQWTPPGEPPQRFASSMMMMDEGPG